MAAFGFDIHGVLDTHKGLVTVCHALMAAGHDVHIITGAQEYVAKKHLEEIGIGIDTHYNKFFSIADHLLAKGIQVAWRGTENPMFSNTHWDGAKAEYCRTHSLVMLFDDSPVYGTYFKASDVTEFVHIGSRIERT